MTRPIAKTQKLTQTPWITLIRDLVIHNGEQRTFQAVRLFSEPTLIVEIDGQAEYLEKDTLTECTLESCEKYKQWQTKINQNAYKNSPCEQ